MARVAFLTFFVQVCGSNARIPSLSIKWCASGENPVLHSIALTDTFGWMFKTGAPVAASRPHRARGWSICARCLPQRWALPVEQLGCRMACLAG